LWEIKDYLPSGVDFGTVSQAYFAFHETLHNFEKFQGKIFFGTKVISEAFYSISQNLKVTRLRGGTQTKLCTC
jgi:hypothetical protein